MKMLTTVLAVFTIALLAEGAQAENGARVTFNKDVAPIFFEKCVSCHRPGQMAPMSLMDFKSARPWAKSIKKEVSEGRMPPWHADSSAVSYLHDRSLSSEQIQAIVKWVDQGAAKGARGDLPKPPEFDEGWAMGTPDMIFDCVTDFTVPANAKDSDIEYHAFRFDMSELTEDLYIAAWEILPKYRTAVHHANLALSPVPFNTEEQHNVIGHAVMTRGDYIGSYLPGKIPTFYPEGYAYKMPAKSHMAIQVHYIGQEEEVTDHIMLGVKFAQGRVDKLVRVVGTDDRNINIPPNDPSWQLVGHVNLLHDLTLLSSGAHMHLRGKDFTMEVIPKEGESQLVTRVPHYDFNWQSIYWLKDPILARKGSMLRTTAHWDNSADNPHNPNPNDWVRYGLWTENEMLNSYAHVVLTHQVLGLKIVDGRLTGKFDDAQKEPPPWLLQTGTITEAAGTD